MRIAQSLAPLLAFVLSSCGQPGGQGADEPAEMQTGAAEEPAPTTGRTPQFENEHVTVWKSVIVPNQPLEMHRHDNPRAIIALKGGTLTVVNDAGERHDMTWETGSALLARGGPAG